MTEEPKVEEEDTQIAPGLALALAPEDQDDGFRRRGPDPLAALRSWQPRTRLGRMVMNGEILTHEQALATGYPIREVEIVDALLPEMEDDVLSVNMIQRMTDSGRRVRFNVLCAVGNKDGYVGLSVCKGKEVASTIQKAITQAKLNLVPVLRGNGSWESAEGPGNSIPFKSTGRSGSTRVTLLPAPSGKGLVIGDYGRRVLTLAGVEDVWSRSSGQTRSTINFARATYNALEELSKTKVSDQVGERLHITVGKEKRMSYLVIRVRSDRGVTKKIRDTMSMLNLTKVNHAVLVPKTPAYEGMLQKAKDYVTWGEVDADTIETLINERGRMAGDKQVTDAEVKSCSDHSTVKALSKAIASGDATTKDVEGMKPVFRLHPPRGAKGWGGIKRAYSVGGALGFRGEDIGELAARMY